LTKRNYEELNQLHERFHSQGLEIVAFPCNQFLHQEPGTNKEIEKFARESMGAKYLLMDKIDVNGTNAIPLYRFLKKVTDQEPVNWNFAKYLVDKQGRHVKHYESGVPPLELVTVIESLLA
jgi:glutathione peroxidase